MRAKFVLSLSCSRGARAVQKPVSSVALRPASSFASIFDALAEQQPSFLSQSSSSCASVSVASRAAQLFCKEKERQKELLARVEKIEVRFLGAPQDCTMMMNRGVSTPYECARHMSENLMKRSAVAEVNGKLWDMHRPLEESCVLRLISLDTPDKAIHEVNTAFWRSCSVMLGSVVRNAFKHNILVIPYSFPPPVVKSGSFVYDVVLDGLKEWNPTKDELRLLSVQMIKLAKADLFFEHLKVELPVALNIMADNAHKTAQLPQIAATSDGTVTLYRIGDYVDVSKGPMVSRTGLLGRCTVTSVRRLKNAGLDLYRFQGVALPSSILLNHFAYSLIEDRGRRFNSARLPEVAQAA